MGHSDEWYEAPEDDDYEPEYERDTDPRCDGCGVRTGGGSFCWVCKVRDHEDDLPEDFVTERELVVTE